MEYEYYNSKIPIIKQSIATRIPPEIFINICQYLPPIDLISFARVCKQFHAYLCSTDSFTTKEIWKNSRIKFLPFVQMPPPEGMTELQYVKFISERGCQFCGKPRIRKIYWAFLVRCCKKCLEDHTIRLDQIKYHLFSQNSNHDDIDIVSGLTFITGSAGSGSEKSLKHRPSNLYWIQDVHKVYNEFNELDVEERQDWIIRKREEGRRKMEEVIKRELENENENLSKTMENSKKRNDRMRTIGNYIRREINEYGFPRFKMSVINKCPSYNKAMCSASTSPFTKRAWIGLRNKLIPEYLQTAIILRLQRQEIERNLPIDVAIQTRQMDIVKMIFELLRPELKQIQHQNLQSNTQTMSDVDMERSSILSSESNSDSDDSSYNNNVTRRDDIFESSLIKFLPWCPSFRNPPFMKQDPRILWNDEFLVNVLIPQLREEALYLKSNPAPLDTVRGAFLHSRPHNKRIYKCKLCDYNDNPPRLYSFYEMRLHLIKSNHKIRMINDELMIEVVPSLINVTCNAQIFPRNKPDLFFAAGFNCNLICNLLS